LEAICQRCHESLRESDRYCPACGLPQLTYIAAEAPLVPLDADGRAQEPGSGSAGYAAVPAAIAQMGGLSSGIVWRPALQTALIMAIPAGVLCEGFTPIAFLWMIAAAAWAVALYARRSSSGKLSAGAGARIGLVTGLIASWLAVAINGVGLWVLRFPMGQGKQMDSTFAAELENSLQVSQKMQASMGMANAQTVEASQMYRNWMLSINGRAGYVLTGLVMGVVILILFAMLGGAVGARMFTPPRRRSV